MMPSLPGCQRNEGSALLLCLILLIAFTQLGISMASAYQLQQRVESNQQRASVAMQTANAALAEAERWLFSLPFEPAPTPCSQSCTSESPIWVYLQVPENIQHLDQTWWQTHARAAGVFPGESHWLIEELRAPDPGLDPPGAPAGYYRVLAMGSDEQGTALAVTESILVRPWVEAAEPEAVSPGSIIHHYCRETGADPCGRVAWRQLR